MKALRFVALSKVPPEERYRLRLVKALYQGLEMAPRTWWPALEGLSPADQASLKRYVADTVTWRCHSATIGRWPNDIPKPIPYAPEGA